MENVHFFYIIIQDLSSLIFYADNIFLRLNLVYSFDFNDIVVLVLMFKHF